MLHRLANESKKAGTLWKKYLSSEVNLPINLPPLGKMKYGQNTPSRSDLDGVVRSPCLWLPCGTNTCAQVREERRCASPRHPAQNSCSPTPTERPRAPMLPETEGSSPTKRPHAVGAAGLLPSVVLLAPRPPWTETTRVQAVGGEMACVVKCWRLRIMVGAKRKEL